MRRSLFLTVIAALMTACSGTAPTPIVIYVTPEPTAAASTALASLGPVLTAPAATTATTAATPAPTPPSPSFRTFGDGVWIVGSDIKAGTYRTRYPNVGCYWERLSGFSGDDIIEN